MVKNPPANAEEAGLIPESGRSPGNGNGNPLQYSCLKNPMERGTRRAKEMSNRHRCSGACPVPPTSATSDASCSCGGELWRPAECHPQCQTHFSSLPDTHLAPKHSPAQKCRGVSHPLTTGMRVKWIQTPSSLPFQEQLWGLCYRVPWGDPVELSPRGLQRAKITYHCLLLLTCPLPFRINSLYPTPCPRLYFGGNRS